ncbi:MAG: APC family permease [Dehalococcoidia bacterium]|nr:APC family permease [Dehalococcoidia bacterium]
MWQARSWLFGRPLTSELESHERLNNKKALAVFASDALSSTAYATEQILIVFVVAGAGALSLSLPVAMAITLLLVMVVVSYRQTVRAYPGGGSSYIVAKENLGRAAGLTAAAALLTDYVLTVAVSISAGSLAVVSAFPQLIPFRVELAVAALIFITIINLRGLRESGTIFAIPTYFFIVGFGAMVAVGLVRLTIGLDGATIVTSKPPQHLEEATATLGVWLILRAFASGATALTGVEAIADGVLAFRAPEWKNASITMLWMAGILAVFFLGATLLATRLGITPIENDSVISQMGRIIFGGENIAYYGLQAGTALVLVLAANTAFNDFPRLSSILARDRHMPRQFAFIGDRLTFSVGIIALALISGAILVAFQADEHRLIPLYAVGVFIAFTLSQGGMFVRWRRERGPGWQRGAAINGAGAALTAVVAVVVASTKFIDGAWFVLLLIPCLVWGLESIRWHYDGVEELLALPEDGYRANPRPEQLSGQPMLVPVRNINLNTARAVEYARRISSTVTAVHIARLTREDIAAFEERWAAVFPDVPLVTIESPYRTFLGPLRAYIDGLDLAPGTLLTIVVPEFVPAHAWQRFLHNRTGDRIEEEFETRQNVLVTRASISIPGLRRQLAQ